MRNRVASSEFLGRALVRTTGLPFEATKAAWVRLARVVWLAGLIAVLPSCFPCRATDSAHQDGTSDGAVRGVVINVEIGRPSQNCNGFGICSVTVGLTAADRTVPTSATWSNGRLQLSFLSEPADKTNVLVIEKDIALDSATSRTLGYEQVIVKAGEYPVDYSGNPHGQVSVNVSARGIVITVEFGRPSRNCTGFGICNITTAGAATDRAIATSADWAGGRLQLSFLAEPPEKTGVLSIEKDLVLDSKMSRALSYEEVTVKAGEYLVDYSVNPHGEVSLDVAARGIVINVEIGRPSKSCREFGICSITIETRLSDRSVPTSAVWAGDGLLLSFLSEPADKTNVLVIEKDLALDSATARALGYEAVTVKAGEYPVDYTVNPHGQVNVVVAARGIVVTVEVGRASRDCRGFGICSITIGFPATDRSVQTSAVWAGDGLLLSFLSEPADKTNVLVIEKDLALDSATSRALGYEQLTVKAGEYPVDYTVNPHGQVNVVVAARGIVVTVEVGRASRDCRGFGICSITIETRLSDRSVPTSAVWAGDGLLLSFLSEPADKTNVLVIEKDLALDSVTSRALGYEQLTVKAGEYPVDYTVNPHGQVNVVVAARGIVVTVEVGRASRDCRGFGICSITIGFPATDRSVQTSAVWAGDGLLLSFLSEPADKTNVLVIEKDLVLDATLSRALGREQITLRAGEYVVDTSLNSHGQVILETVVQHTAISLGANGSINLSWPQNGWILQESDSIVGPWVNAESQSSPLSLTPVAGKKFYRLINP